MLIEFVQFRLSSGHVVINYTEHFTFSFIQNIWEDSNTDLKIHIKLCQLHSL